MTKHRKLLVLGLVVMALAGCGRRGPLEPAGSASASKPEEKLATGADIGISNGRTAKPTPVQPGNAPFFLDFLL